MKDFADKVAVVTGSANGIGRALAERFAAAGMKVVLSDVEQPALDLAVKELEQTGAQVIGVRTDVSSLEAVEHLRDRTLEHFGAVHLICNNAGIGTGSPLLETQLERWRWMLDVNLWGLIYGCRTFVPLLIEQREGHVVNLGSLAGIVGSPTYGAYATTKMACVGYSEVLAQELAMAGSPVKVSVVCPGLVRTRTTGTTSDRNKPAYVPDSPVATALAQGMARAMEAGMAMEPTDVAEIVLQGVRDERFFIFPSPEGAQSCLATLTAWIVDDTPPAPFPTMPE